MVYFKPDLTPAEAKAAYEERVRRRSRRLNQPLSVPNVAADNGLTPAASFHEEPSTLS